MNEQSNGSQEQSPFGALRRMVRPRKAVERCDICGADLPDEHSHLVEPVSRQLICACAACVVSVGEQGTKYRRVPRAIHALPGFRLNDNAWDSLMIPVGMAFFFYSSPMQRVVAFYPSPAGPTESELTLESWQDLEQTNPVLREMEPDVQALLVNRIRGSEEYYLVPIDRCYELVGLIRLNWRGLSGGAEVWNEIYAFFARLKSQAVGPGEAARAEA